MECQKISSRSFNECIGKMVVVHWEKVTTELVISII